MLNATLFTTAKIWNQSSCPRRDEKIKKNVGIYTVEMYSAVKETAVGAFSGK